MVMYLPNYMSDGFCVSHLDSVTYDISVCLHSASPFDSISMQTSFSSDLISYDFFSKFLFVLFCWMFTAFLAFFRAPHYIIYDLDVHFYFYVGILGSLEFLLVFGYSNSVRSLIFDLGPLSSESDSLGVRISTPKLIPGLAVGMIGVYIILPLRSLLTSTGT